MPRPPGLAVTFGLRALPIGGSAMVPWVYSVGAWPMSNSWPAINMAVRREAAGTWVPAKDRRRGLALPVKAFKMERTPEGVTVTRTA